MRFQRILTPVLCATVLAACASTQAKSPPDPNSDAAQVSTVLAAANTWTGNFTPTQSYTGNVVTTTRQKANGRVQLSVSPNRPTLTYVRLTVTVPVEPGLTNLGWGIHPGNCGSGAPPVMGPGMFPTLVVSANGRATFEDNIAFTLPQSGTYHVNVFRGNGTQLSDVITCATLRRES